MKEELTREVLEAMKRCKQNCPSCIVHGINGATHGEASAYGFCGKYNWQEMMQALATALLEERAKPKVWDGAPEDAVSAVVTWCRSGEIVGSVSYNRELPKTRARQIAEQIAENKDIEYVEGVLKRYAEELKGES